MFSQKKAYSAVTVSIESLTAEGYEEDDLGGIPDLVEQIRLQPGTGTTEASRAIRKKLKYGNVHRQIRALIILDALIKNAGETFQRNFADEMLLERLRFCGTDDLSDPKVRAKCKALFLGWAREYGKSNSRGLQAVAALSKQLPQRKQGVTQKTSKVIRETDPFAAEEDHEDEETLPRPVQAESSRRPQVLGEAISAKPSLSFKKVKKDKKSKSKQAPFNLEAEKENIKNTIGDSTIAAGNLLNALRLINREEQRISENQNAVHHFDNCKGLRRKVLRYVQIEQAAEWLGALLEANDRLVEALMTFEHLDKSVDADSDSDDELAHQQHLYKMSAKGSGSESTADQLASLNLSSAPPTPTTPRPVPPLRPIQKEEQEEEDDDPFSDSNAVETPAIERGEPQWK